MIAINLAPTEELENRHWYGFDLLSFVCSCLLLFVLSQLYILFVETKISRINTEQHKLELQNNTLKISSDRFDEIHRLIDREDKNLQSIRSITTSKITKYEPVILLEYLQTLKPDGVWLDSIQENHEKKMILITGGAFDNVLIADFMTLLAETKHIEPSSENIRSLVHFTDVILEKVSIDGTKTDPAKTVNPSARFDASSSMVADRPFGKSDSGSKITQKIFPDIKGRPIFSMLLRYERSQVDTKGVN